MNIPREYKLEPHYQIVNRPIPGSDIFVIRARDNNKPMTYGKLFDLTRKCREGSSDDYEQRFWKGLKERSKRKSGMPQYCILEDETCFAENSAGWNLSKFTKDHSVIHALPKQLWMKGIQKPYVYIGMFGTSFQWHREDRNLMSINYLHSGAAKLWYTVPEGFAHRLEQMIQQKIETMSPSKRAKLRTAT